MPTDYEKLMEEYDKADASKSLEAARKEEWKAELKGQDWNKVSYYVAQKVDEDQEALKIFREIRSAMKDIAAGKGQEQATFDTIKKCREGLVGILLGKRVEISDWRSWIEKEQEKNSGKKDKGKTGPRGKNQRQENVP